MQFLIDIGLSLVYFCIFLLLCAWSWRFWMMYINQKYLNKVNSEMVMLEIKLPREIFKSPLATELALSSLLQSGGLSVPYKRVFAGVLPIYSSLEIASLEGVIHFYIRVQKKFKILVESNFYAQYPGIEIIEADDYTKKIRYHHLSKDTDIWGASYRLSQTWTPTNEKTGEPFKDKGEDYKMHADFLPIKTYVDYGLDKDPKEEFKVDPLTPLLEILGSMGKGEYFWYQILMQDEGVYNDKKMPKFFVNTVNHKHVSLSDMAVARKKQIRTAGYAAHGSVVLDDYGYERTRRVEDGFDEDGKPKTKEIPLTYNINDPKKPNQLKVFGKKEMDLTQDEKDEIEAINKKLSKPLALAVMRAIYVTKKENFNFAHINSILAVPKPFKGFNGFAPSVTDPYDYPWENFMNRRVPWRGEEKFEEYVEREGFYPHIGERTSLDKWEDRFFWSSSMKSRKLFRMIYEAIFYPFDHPHPKDAFVVNLEELATLWHLPGATAGTPTLPRIDSNKGVAPTNLPL